MTKAGQEVQVQHVLTGMVIYLAMAVNLPGWAFKAIDKIRRSFLWRGRKYVKGGTVMWHGTKFVSHLS
jgi:hypothetical protein